MAKVEIKVPDGKIADVTKDGDKVIVTFKEANILDRLKDFVSVESYIRNLAEDLDVEWAKELWQEYMDSRDGTYSKTVCKYRMVVAALTNNEKRHLTSGGRWLPVIQFCKPGKEKNCWGSEVIGTIKSEGQTYTVVGGVTYYGVYAGLSNFYSHDGISYSDACIGFRSVFQREIAEHISKYFGRLLFEVHYGGTNCDWAWLS